MVRLASPYSQVTIYRALKAMRFTIFRFRCPNIFIWTMAAKAQFLHSLNHEARIVTHSIELVSPC